MEQTKIESFVRNRRTQARTMDTMVKTDMLGVSNPAMTEAYNSIENIAKKYENFQIENEKNKVILEMEKMEQEYNNNFLQDPTIYSDQDKFKSAVDAYKELNIKKNDLLRDSSYLTKQDIDHFNVQNTRVAGETLTSMSSKRNQMYIKDVQDTALLNLRQMEDYGSTLTNNNPERLKYVQEGIKKTYEALVGVGMNKVKASALVGDSMANIQYSMLNKEMLDISNNPDMTYQQKLGAMRTYKNKIADPAVVNALTEELANNFDFDDEQKEALKLNLTTRGNKIKNSADKEIERMVYNIKREQSNSNTNNRTVYPSEAKYIREKKQYDKMLETGDIFQYQESENDLVYTTQDVLNDNYALQSAYQMDIKDVGNPNDPRVINVVSKGDMDILKNEIANMKQDGASNYDIADRLYEYASMQSQGDIDKETAILKDLGNRVSGFTPTVLVNGRNDRRYLNVADTYKTARQDYDIEETKIKNGLFGGGTKSKYNQLLTAGGATNAVTKGKIDRYIAGYIMKNGTAAMASGIKSGGLETVVSTYLKDDENFEALLADMPLVQKTYVSPTRYTPIKLNPKHRKYTNQQTVNQEEAKAFEEVKKEVDTVDTGERVVKQPAPETGGGDNFDTFGF